MRLELTTYWSSLSHHNHYAQESSVSVSDIYRKAFSSLQSCFTVSSLIQLFLLIKRIYIQNYNIVIVNFVLARSLPTLESTRPRKSSILKHNPLLPKWHLIAHLLTAYMVLRTTLFGINKDGNCKYMGINTKLALMPLLPTLCICENLDCSYFCFL